MTTNTTSDESGKKSGRMVTLTVEDMQKKKNDVKERITLLLSLPDEHQLLAPEWLMHTIVWRNMSDLDTISLDDLYNHLKVYESEVQKKSEPNSQNMAFISSAKHSSGNEDGNTACVPTASTNVPTASASIDEDDMEEMDIKWNMALLSIRADKFWKKTGKKISIQGSDVAGFDKSKRSDKIKDGLGYSAVPPPIAQLYLSPKKDLSWTGLSECADDIGSSQNSNNDKGYWDSGCSRHMTECIVLERDFKLLDDANILLRTPRQHNMYSINLNNIVSHRDLTYLVTKASADKCTLWHRRLGHLNFKTMNKLVRHNLVRGLPTKYFENNHTCTACLKEKQHKASCKSKLVNSVTKPLHTLYMDLFGPTSAHDALLEFSSSKPQDHCSTKAPEGSGKPNPTASTSNPPVDQIESLTVETPIPTVSSPVPTAYSTDFEETSSDARLISKRVANQVETPSLDNILSLTNRILKDHPTSQIIGPVDTPIQTRNKFKETLVDCPKGVRPIGIKWVLKNKKDERGIVIRNKARLVAQRHTQEEGIDYNEVFAPVARIKAIRLFLAYASFMGFTVYQMDVKSAFLYGTINKEVEFEALMHEKFQMSAMGELNFFLGLQVLQKKDGIFLSQDKYVGDILKKFGYSDIRPDIMFAVCAYARHQMTSKECHLHTVKRIFKYLKGHPKLGLWYPKESPFDLVAYLDSDYGGATQDHKSTTRGCQFLGRRLISWQCKKQTIVATSTTEAKYVAAASYCGQVLWIQN
nr:hypothetical protein [Tanacetum cinerariifolium]